MILRSGPLSAAPLTKESAWEVATWASPEDRAECLALGTTALNGLSGALLYAGMQQGTAAAVYSNYREDNCAIGAFGYTMDSIWSLWQPLKKVEQIWVARLTAPMTRALVVASKKAALKNAIHVENKTALRWLELSGCFNVDPDKAFKYNATTFIPFQTKPLEELEKLCASRSSH